MIPVAEFKTGDIPSTFEGVRRKILTFGQYTGLTYEQALANDPDYCQWHVDNLRDADEAGAAFAEWLTADDLVSRKRKEMDEAMETESVEAKRARVVDFGKFRDQDLTYGEVFDNHPGYCQVLLKKQDDKPVKRNVRRFLTFVKQNGVDLNARVREMRQAERDAPHGVSVPPS